MADVIEDIYVNDALSVGWHVVVPFSVRGVAANGDRKTVEMFPLTARGRFRKQMAWAIQAIASLGFYDSNYDNCARHLNCAPVVRDIVAAATSAKTRAVRRTTRFRYVDASGSPLPTFIEVEVRGQTLTVTTHSPVYVERSIAVVQWLVKELQADAAATTPLDFASPVKAVRALTDIDELSASKCEGTPVKYAPSKRSFMAVWGDRRDKAFFHVRRRAVSSDREIAEQFNRAIHVASFGQKLEETKLAKRPRKRRDRSVRVVDEQVSGSDTDTTSVDQMRATPRSQSLYDSVAED